MSTHLLGPCWRIVGLSSTQKLVLISLADQANDDGVCWPSVKTMKTRTALSERAIRYALRDLEQLGLLVTHQRDLRSSYYTVTPWGATLAPVAQSAGGGAPNAPWEGHQVPVPGAPDAPRTIKEPPGRTVNEPARFRAADVELPACVPREAWLSWCSYHRERRKSLSESTVARQLKKLADYHAKGIKVADVIDNSIECGYQGLFPPKAGFASKQEQWREKARVEGAAFVESIQNEGLFDANQG